MAKIVQLSRFRSPPPEAPWWVVRREMIPASPERVWQALTDPEEMVHWWCDCAEVRLEKGGRYAFGGRHVYGDPMETRAIETAVKPGEDFEIVDFEPAARLVFRWSLLGVETLVRYELENELESTRLTVTQTARVPPGWNPGSGPNWWWVALPSLRTFIEKGESDLRIDYHGLRSAGAISLEARCSTFPWIIWHKLTSPTEIRRWWAPVIQLEPRAGGTFRLELDTMGPSRVLETSELSRFVHDWVWPGGAVGQIEWSLEETETCIILRVTDLGPWDPAISRDAGATLWGATLLQLKQLSERGVTPREYQDG